MTKIFIIGISSKLARKFIIDHNLINVSIHGTYNKNNITKLFTKNQFQLYLSFSKKILIKLFGKKTGNTIAAFLGSKTSKKINSMK